MEWLAPLGWIGGTIISLLSLFGVARLIENWQKRRYGKLDRDSQLHETNEGKRIDADVNAFNAVMERLKSVEKRLDELSDKLSQEMQKSARLEAENDALRKDNDRQEKEIQRQRVSLHDIRNLLQQRDAQIYKLQQELKELTARFDAVKDEK